MTSFVAVEERESGEVLDLEPNVDELLSSVTVDLLPYLDWQIDPSRQERVKNYVYNDNLYRYSCYFLGFRRKNPKVVGTS